MTCVTARGPICAVWCRDRGDRASVHPGRRACDLHRQDRADPLSAHDYPHRRQQPGALHLGGQGDSGFPARRARRRHSAPLFALSALRIAPSPRRRPCAWRSKRPAAVAMPWTTRSWKRACAASPCRCWMRSGIPVAAVSVSGPSFRVTAQKLPVHRQPPVAVCAGNFGGYGLRSSGRGSRAVWSGLRSWRGGDEAAVGAGFSSARIVQKDSLPGCAALPTVRSF
jgi:hypothetical protein